MPLSNGGYVRKYYSKGDIDFVLVFYPVTKKVYKIPVGELCKGNGTLRLTQTKNGQVKKVKLAQDYEF